MPARKLKYTERWTKEKDDACKRRWRERNPNANKIYHIRHRYGLSLEDAKQVVSGQFGSCQICGLTKKLELDHDHTSGQIRGMVCRRCNLMIEALERPMPYRAVALQYLARWREVASTRT